MLYKKFCKSKTVCRSLILSYCIVFVFLATACISSSGSSNSTSSISSNLTSESTSEDSFTPTPVQTSVQAKTPTSGDWIRSGEYWYFSVDGENQTGWLKLDDAMYYLDDTGVMQTGWAEIGDDWFYFDSSGIMQTGWIELNDNWYFFSSDGRMATGLHTVDSTLYYFEESSGAMNTGWVQVGENWYYFEKNGAGFNSGWKRISGNWFWFDDAGIMATGEKRIDGDYYTFSDDGSLQFSSSNYTGYSVRTLFDDLNNNAYRAEQEHQDEYVAVRGYIRNIDSDGKYFSLGTAQDDWDYIFDSIHCSIKSSFIRSQIADYDTYDYVTVYGKITDIGEVLGYYIDVELIDS